MLAIQKGWKDVICVPLKLFNLSLPLSYICASLNGLERGQMLYNFLNKCQIPLEGK